MTPRHHLTRSRARRSLMVLVAMGALSVGVIGLPALGAGPAAHAAPDHARTSSTSIAKRAEGAVRVLTAYEADRNPADYVRFVQARDAVADLIATDLGQVAGEIRDQLAQPSLVKQHAVLAALSQLGVPYRSMASEEGKGFDCSGLTSYAYAEAGVAIPRSSGDQIRASVRGDRALSEAGDLVHYPGHIGMYLGGNIYVHSPEPGRDVEVVEMPDRSLSFGDVTSGS